jgi:hypothetical protein
MHSLQIERRQAQRQESEEIRAQAAVVSRVRDNDNQIWRNDHVWGAAPYTALHRKKRRGR